MCGLCVPPEILTIDKRYLSLARIIWRLRESPERYTRRDPNDGNRIYLDPGKWYTFRDPADPQKLAVHDESRPDPGRLGGSVEYLQEVSPSG